MDRLQKNLQFGATLFSKQTSDQEFAWFKPTVINCNCNSMRILLQANEIAYTASLAVYMISPCADICEEK